MYNPFQEKYEEETKDSDYIERSIKGDMKALEAIVLRHQAWIYNIAVAMTGDIHIAEDITQEVLIKIITKLSSYDSHKASFRTWLYRIVVNHILNMRENQKEKFFSKIEIQSGLDFSITQHPDNRKSMQPGYSLIHEEVKIACVTCALLCLSRKERIIFTLGTIFNTSDRIGAEICGTSKENFRKILSRSRAKLYNFFNKNCSLMNENNSCTCDQQTELLIKAGMINLNNLLVKQDAHGSIQDMLGEVINELEDSYFEFVALFREQPFLKGPDMIQWLRDLFNRSDFKGLFIKQ